MQDEVNDQEEGSATVDSAARDARKRKIYIKMRLDELNAEKERLREELKEMKNN